MKKEITFDCECDPPCYPIKCSHCRMNLPTHMYEKNKGYCKNCEEKLQKPFETDRAFTKLTYMMMQMMHSVTFEERKNEKLDKLFRKWADAGKNWELREYYEFRICLLVTDLRNKK